MLPPFLTDESIPDSVGDVLERAGYEVFRARDLAAPGTPDAAIARLSDERGAILVANDAHFRGSFSPMTTERISIRKLKRFHRVIMRCREIHMARRIEELLPLIEYEYAQFQLRDDKRMHIQIGDASWTSFR